MRGKLVRRYFRLNSAVIARDCGLVAFFLFLGGAAHVEFAYPEIAIGLPVSILASALFVAAIHVANSFALAFRLADAKGLKIREFVETQDYAAHWQTYLKRQK